ncbi:MAG: hypothetical protein ACR2KN_05500 [Geodermatophilaceae bacterium]
MPAEEVGDAASDEFRMLVVDGVVDDQPLRAGISRFMTTIVSALDG